jgi:hypothetical protein
MSAPSYSEPAVIFDPSVIAETSPQSARLPYEPFSALAPAAWQDDAELAPCNGKRIGILIVTYNAITTLPKVLKRITPNVWNNVEEIAVFDDASQDATFELAVGMKTLGLLPKLQVLKHRRNLGYGGNQRPGIAISWIRVSTLSSCCTATDSTPLRSCHICHPIVSGDADAVFGSRMMKTYGGPLRRDAALQIRR